MQFKILLDRPKSLSDVCGVERTFDACLSSTLDGRDDGERVISRAASLASAAMFSRNDVALSKIYKNLN